MYQSIIIVKENPILYCVYPSCYASLLGTLKLLKNDQSLKMSQKYSIILTITMNAFNSLLYF